MKHRTSPQQARINAEVEARRAAAMQAVADKKHEQENAEAVSLVEECLGGTVLYMDEFAEGVTVNQAEVLRSY